PEANVCLKTEKYVDGFLVISFRTTINRTRLKWLMKRRWDIVVVDESQNLKSRTSAQSRAARRIARSAAYRLILTGTPVDELDDQWAQFDFVDSDILGPWENFRDEFMRQKSVAKGVKIWVMRKRQEANLARLLR